MNYFNKISGNEIIPFAVNNIGHFLCMASKTLEGARVAFWLTASRKQQLFTNKQDRAIAFIIVIRNGKII